MSAALGNEGGSSQSGVKGCVARDRCKRHRESHSFQCCRRRRPAGRPSEQWPYEELRGEKDAFGRSAPADLLGSAKCTKLAARWLRFLLVLAGDIERNPGPGFQARPRIPRGQLSMDVGFAAASSKGMQLCLDEFAKFLLAEFALTLDSIGWDFTVGPLALRAYGLHLFASGSPRNMFVYTITAMQDTFPHLRPFFSSSWQIDRKWQQHEPGHCRPVWSAPILRAICSWYRWLGITLIGFLGMLHPAEVIHLADILLPGDTLRMSRLLFMCASGIQKQHASLGSNTVRLKTRVSLYGLRCLVHLRQCAFVCW